MSMPGHFLRDIPLRALQRKVGDERVNLLQACYDNPLFTEEDDRDRHGNGSGGGGGGKVRGNNSSGGGGAGSNHHRGTSSSASSSSGLNAGVPGGGHQDGRLPMAKDYMHSLPPGSAGGGGGGPGTVPEIRYGEKRRRRFLVKFLVVCLVVVAVAVIIGLIVHFQNDQDSSLRTSPPVISSSRQLQGSLTIVDGPFSVYKKEYEDNSSSSFSLLLKSFQFKMDSIFTHSSFKDIYNRTDILKISPGLDVHFVIRLRDLENVSPADVQTMTSLIHNGFRNSLFVIKEKSVRLTPEFSVPRTTVNPTGHAADRCEVIRIPDCANMTSYQYTAFPNTLGHPTQEVAGHALNQVLQTMMRACHGYTQGFLCSLFAPECGPRSRPIPPCRSFCQEVQGRCNSSMSPGASFPVDCNTLPESDNPNICMPSPYKPGQCVPIMRVDLCRQEGFNTTAFPNLLGNEGENEVIALITLMKGVEVATRCYKYSMLFGCSALLPPCSGNETVGHHNIPPCRSLCKAYRNRCEIFLDIFYTPWPDALDCDKLVDSPDPRVCVGYKEARELPALGDCKPGQMRCDGGRCIESAWVCDGYQDCKDNADESHCAVCHAHETLCSPVSTLCINTTNVCDGDDHCYEGVDEVECVRVGDHNDTRVLEVRNPIREEWEEVCSKGWNQTFALLTCKQLGYSEVLTHSLETPTPGRSKSVLTDIMPGGHPDRLQSFLSKGHASCPVGDAYVIKLSCWEPVCGTRPANYMSPLRVVGGDEVKPGTWPWVVSMHGGSDQAFFCGASVISAEWILTAGHCVGGGTRETNYWTLIAGHTRRPAYSPHRQIRKPKKLFLHPEFDPTTVNNDIALIQLAKPLVLGDYLRPVCLPKPGADIDIGTRCYVAGWGKTDTQAPTYEPAVRQVNLDVVTWESCMASVLQSEMPVPYKLTHNMFCAGGAAGHDACQGDSGGPFMCRMPNTTDQWYQAGIVSWGISCAIPNAPGIYTKLPLYLDWINETIKNNTRT